MNSDTLNWVLIGSEGVGVFYKPDPDDRRCCDDDYRGGVEDWKVRECGDSDGDCAGYSRDVGVFVFHFGVLVELPATIATNMPI